MQAANTNAAQDAATAQQKSKTGAGIVGKTAGSYNVDPATITIRPGFNVRFDMGDIDGLANEIKTKLDRDPDSGGLIHALGVKRIAQGDELAAGGKYVFEVVRGHRRTTALGLLLKRGVKFPNGVPITLLDKNIDDLTAITEMFMENSGKPLLPLEEAAAFKRLFDHGILLGIKKADIFKWIGKQVGRSDIFVWETLQLLTADEAVQEALKTKSIGSTTAKQIAIHAKGDSAKQKELVAAAKAVGKDKGKKAALKKQLDEARRSKHAKKGRALKIRALSDTELSDLGKKVAEDMVTKLKDANKPADFDLAAWIGKDDKLALAATYGMLQALKAAAGMKINLSI